MRCADVPRLVKVTPRHFTSTLARTSNIIIAWPRNTSDSASVRKAIQCGRPFLKCWQGHWRLDEFAAVNRSYSFLDCLGEPGFKVAFLVDCPHRRALCGYGQRCFSKTQESAVLVLGKVLYDQPHQPPLPDGWILRTLLALAALMRSFGALLAMGTSSILLGLAFEPLGQWIPMPRRLGANLLAAIPALVMCLLISGLLLHYTHRAKLSDLGLGLNRSALKEGLLAMLLGAFSLALVVAPPLLLGLGTFAAAETKIKGPYGLAVLLILLAVAALSEELLMRGYAFQSLVQPMHLLGALLLTSGAFAALHAGNRGANEFSIANTFLAGCAIGMVVAVRRNLWAAVGAHFGWNLGTILFGLNLSGLSIPVVPFKVEWRLDSVWTGGAYGPEGGLLCTVTLSAILLLLVMLYYQKQADQVHAE